MALPNLEDDLNIIQGLADRPNALDGLSAAQLKQKFDEAGNTIKEFINDILIPALALTEDGNSGADNIGATEVTDLDGTTVQALIESLRNKLKATTGGSSGAGFIGASTISGLSGNTVQALLEALKTYIDNQDGQIGANYVSKTELTTTRKLDASGDFTGSWFGVTNPAKSDPGIAGLVELHTAQLADIAINVKTYGAGGRGLTDDTDAISAAMNYLKSIGGGELLFPEGIYNSRVNVFENVSNVVIKGYGAKIRTTALEENPAKRSPLTFTNCFNISIFGLEVDGQFDTWVAPPNGAVNHCLAFIECQNILIRDCYLHDSGTQRAPSDKYGDGVYATGASTDRFTIDNCRLENCARWGIAILSGSFHRITNNDYLYNKDIVTRFGFLDLEYSSNPKGSEIVIDANNVSGGANLKLSGVNGFENVIISNNNIDGSINGVLSTYVNLAIIIDNTTNLKVSGNNVVNIYGEGLYLENCHQVNVSSNEFYGESSRVMSMRLGTSYVKISNNTFLTARNSGSATGIDIDGAESYIDIVNNKISAVFGFGILSDSPNVRVVGNDIVSASNNGFRLLSYPHYVESNTVNGGVGAGGRLSAHAHTVINNNMTIGTSGGNWWEGGGYYYNPDLSKGGRSQIYLSAAPTAGTWKIGDIVFNIAPTASGFIGWVCVTAGTPGTWKTFGAISA